jgi:GTP-binding protein
MSQVGQAPPKFILFASHPEAINASYHRFLVNRLRDEFGFSGATVRLEVRKSE